jgi:SNF2 family DNA or RNA helicase
MSIAIGTLTSGQNDIVDECVAKGSGALSLAMGSGKTAIALHVATILSPTLPIIIVMPKTLMTSWEHEICKFFGTTLPYEVLHQERMTNPSAWVLGPETRLVLTTSEFLSKAYRAHTVDEHFVYRRENEWVGYTNVYLAPSHPLVSPEAVKAGPGVVYTMTWGCLIVDEAHGFCNILVDKCRCIASLCVQHRWLLSGTLFSEPKPENLLGHYVLLDHPDNPGDLASMRNMIRRDSFKGLRQTLVTRTQAPTTRPLFTVRRHIVQTPLTPEEATVYTTCREILRSLNDSMHATHNAQARRRYSCYLLSVITYLREIMIAPIIVLASVALDACKMHEGSELSRIVMQRLDEAQLTSWLQTEAPLISSRCQAVLDTLRNLCGTRPRVIIFSGFRVPLKLLRHLITSTFTPDEWTVLELTGESSMRQKAKTLEAFRTSPHSVLLTTYQTASEGLNLQCCDTVFLLDVLWSSATSSQAVARVARMGQTSPFVDVFTFLGNTGIEHVVYEKHINKLEIAEDLLDGATSKRPHRMKVQEVVKLVLCDETRGVYHDSLRPLSVSV